jgi:cyclopropane-fatty-acyl-phospholipid synthase
MTTYPSRFNPHAANDSVIDQRERFPLLELDVSAFPRDARFVVNLLSKIEYGALTIQFPDGQSVSLGKLDSNEIQANFHINDWQVFRSVLKSGDIGFAESYIAGHWSTDNLVGLIELISRNRAALEKVIYGTWFGKIAYLVRHFLNRNSRTGSQKNIHAHYDIGNDFYRLWLDPSMTYSSALFASDQIGGLHAAQLTKYRRILNELQVEDGANILEIGCGWGGFAELAAREKSAHVTGLTLSTEQLHFAQERLKNAGLHHKSKLQIQDYRDAHGEYDGIASIEMFEAVGEAYWPSYFECVSRNLKPQGRACIQTIVIADELFERYRVGTDFIQQYIFPGGMLPSISVFKQYAAKHGLEVVETFKFGLDYARTLMEWRKTFMDKLELVKALGFDDEFVRTWEFYLAYCEAGFRTTDVNVVQFTLVKS